VSSPRPVQPLRTIPATPDSAGKMTVLGLERVKARLGPRWDKVSLSVHRFFESALERQMRPGDTSYKIDELSYIVIFRDMAYAEAQIKCIAVAEDVCRRLFGEQTGDVSIRAIVGQLDNLVLSPDVELVPTVAETLERCGRATIVCEDGASARREDAARPTTQRRSSEHLVHLAFGPTFERPVPVPVDQISFLYRPVWDSFRQVVLMYLCQPVPPKGEAMLCMAPHHENDRLDLDLLSLNAATQQIGRLRGAGVRLLMACPIHFSTIARNQQWTEYLRRLQKVPAETSRDLAFLVLGIDGGVPNTRIAQEVPKLAQRCKAVFAAVDRRERQLKRFAGVGFQAVGLELERPKDSERSLIDHVNSFARETANLGLDSFILGANSTSTIVNAVGAGVRYLEGKSVWPAVAEPRHAFVHEMTDLYREIVAL
jgi:hypothetical protein